MKRWSWWIYLGLVHLALAWLMIIPGRSYLKQLNMPIRFAWLKPAAWPELGLSAQDVSVMMGDTKIGVVKHGNETIASFIFEANALDTLIFRWPGNMQEYSLGQFGISIDSTGGVLSNNPTPPELKRFFIDRDRDGLPDTESRSTPDHRAMLRAEWIMEWQMNRASGVYEFFSRDSDLVARATPDDTENPTTWLLERPKGEQVTGSEFIADKDFNTNTLVREFNPGR